MCVITVTTKIVMTIRLRQVNYYVASRLINHTAWFCNGKVVGEVKGEVKHEAEVKIKARPRTLF